MYDGEKNNIDRRIDMERKGKVRERNIQRKEEEERIKTAKYNFRYKEINEGCPRYKG